MFGGNIQKRNGKNKSFNVGAESVAYPLNPLICMFFRSFFSLVVVSLRGLEEAEAIYNQHFILHFLMT